MKLMFCQLNLWWLVELMQIRFKHNFELKINKIELHFIIVLQLNIFS